MIFVFTVDTEWDRKPDKNRNVTVRNLAMLPRLHKICVDAGVRPTYMCAYEVIADKEFCKFGKAVIKKNEGEIGTHLHPWTNPPFFLDLGERLSRTPFPHEYRLDEFEEKLFYLKRELEKRFERQRSYRAGRFGFIPEHVSVLSRAGFVVDSSVTPHVSWKNVSGLKKNSGPDFSDLSAMPFIWKTRNDSRLDILEVPVSILIAYPFLYKIVHQFMGKNIASCFGMHPLWLRPLPQTINYLEKIASLGTKQRYPVLCMMMHSNELAPGCNPYFNTQDKVELLLKRLKTFFIFLQKGGVEFLTLTEFAEKYKPDIHKRIAQ